MLFLPQKYTHLNPDKVRDMKDQELVSLYRAWLVDDSVVVPVMILLPVSFPKLSIINDRLKTTKNTTSFVGSQLEFPLSQMLALSY